MELALQAPAIALETQNAKPAVVYSKYILRIGNGANGPDSDYVQEHIFFSNVSIGEAIKKVQSDTNIPDAILINPESISDDIAILKDLSQKRAIPLILYTPKYDKAVKTLA